MKKLIILALLALPCASWAQSTVFSTKDGAIKGYDPVAYFTTAKPLKGNKQFKFTWQGADWYFASQENLTAFKNNPEKYAPQFGGYCAYGVAQGYKVKIEPEAWAIVDGKLYLNYDLDVQKMWNEDRAGYIKTAEGNWVKIKEKK